MEKKIDLHIHTTCSDGSLSPKEVIDKSLQNGVSIISITDHDTIDAYNKDLYEYAKEKDIKIISGVEISTKSKKCGIHVLGYNFDINNQEFKDNLFLQRNARHDYLCDVASKLKELGYILNVEQLNKIDAVTKAHISLDIVNNAENAELLLKTFGKIPDMGEFIETIMNEGCPAYTEKRSITPKQAAEMIRKAGGKVVLAHPVAYIYEDKLNSDDILEIIWEMNPDGIESYYLYVNRENKEINDIAMWCEFAQTNSLFQTIGSDFHTSDGLRPEIGLDYNKFTLTEVEIDQIIEDLTSC